MKKFGSWFKYAPQIWISLSIGWLLVLIAITPLTTLDQSGALLICSVVIAEIFFKNGHQAFLDAMGPLSHSLMITFGSGLVSFGGMTVSW